MNCHCGRPLHYSDERVRLTVEQLIAQAGDDFLSVTIGERTWRVQRHYIALHGLRASELPTLGFEEIPYTPDDRARELTRLIQTLRADVARGVGHECDEWWTPEGRCALCDRTIPRLEEFVFRGRAAQFAVDQAIAAAESKHGKN